LSTESKACTACLAFMDATPLCVRQLNQLEREIQHKTGGPSQPPLGKTRTKHKQMPAIIWIFLWCKEASSSSWLYYENK